MTIVKLLTKTVPSVSATLPA